ncbi:hypothetical protein YC2023_036600 [Brassica napus]
MGLRMSESAKPYFAMVCLQFGYAGMNLVSKAVLDRGMSHYVLVSYRNAFATAAIAPFAFLSERKVRSKITSPIFMHIFVLALLALDGESGDEKSKMSSESGGDFSNIGWIHIGDITMVLSSISSDLTSVPPPLRRWPASTLKKYSAHLSLSTMVCFMGTLQSLALTFVMEYNPSALSIGLDMNLLASAYAGIMSSSIAYYVQGLMMQRKGPVFVAAFNPLVVVIVSVMSLFVLEQGIYLGGVLGVVVLTVGVYAVLWGKHVDDIGEELYREDNPVLEAVKCCSRNYGLTILPKIKEADEDVQTRKVQAAEKESSLAVMLRRRRLCLREVDASSDPLLSVLSPGGEGSLSLASPALVCLTLDWIDEALRSEDKAWKRRVGLDRGSSVFLSSRFAVVELRRRLEMVVVKSRRKRRVSC